MTGRFPTALAVTVMMAGAGGAAAQTVDKQVWVASMQQILPAAFCQDGTYFRACFTQAPAACHAAANRATAACLRQYDAQIPARLRQPVDGENWGQKVGSCAGTLFETSVRKNKVDSATCNNPAAWK